MTAAGLLRSAVSEGRLVADRLPAGLRSMVTGGEERDASQLLPVLLRHVDDIRSLLEVTGHEAAAASLLSGAQLRALDIYNPHLRELLQAVQEQGHLIVLHNDFGLARILEDFRYGPERPDGRYGMPLLSLLQQYQGAKVIIAHMGMGKFTAPTPAYIQLWGRIFDDPGLQHVSTDISWNEVARHLRSTPEITKAFIELVRRHDDRIIQGTDGVKPESLSQYFRQSRDLKPLMDLVRAEVGVQAWSNIRHANLERLLAAARRDTQQWAYVQLRSGAWDEVLAQVSPAHRRVLDEWLIRYELERDEAALPRPDSEVAVVGPGDWRNRADPATAQLRNLLRWHNAVTQKVVSAQKLITWRLLLASVRASREDHKRARAARAQARREARLLGRAHDTAGLELLDPNGQPYTLEALIAADQAQRALGAPEITGNVLREVQRVQLAQDAADREMARQRTRFLVKVAAGAVVVAVVLAVGVPMLQMTALLSYAAYALRGGLTLYRTIYSQQIRWMIESILERGQFDPNTIDVLIAKSRKYAVLSGMGRTRLQRLDATTDAFRVEVVEIGARWDALAASGRASAAQIQELRDEALAKFSVLLDKAGVDSGVQHQSFPAINADAGLLGRTIGLALAGTYVLHFVWHVQQAATVTGLGTVAGLLTFWVNALYAVDDLLFFLPAIASVITGLAGKDIAAHHPISRKITHWLGLPLSTLATALLTALLVVQANPLMAVPAAVLTIASGYLAYLGLAVELGLGRRQPRRGAWGGTYLAASLFILGAIGVATTSWPLLVIGLTTTTALLLTFSKIDTWRANHTRPPPPTTHTGPITLAATPASAGRWALRVATVGLAAGLLIALTGTPAAGALGLAGLNAAPASLITITAAGVPAVVDNMSAVVLVGGLTAVGVAMGRSWWRRKVKRQVQDRGYELISLV
ncbi:MAG TPA: hypothetical protein VHH34_19660, partial [Pseudonocardiaceae bacterium]|nr:hypothetical protein [Pseudonocardiaceae bacterium]